MSIQTIIDSAQSIEINRRAIVAQTISRSQQIKTAERGYRAWKFIITPAGVLQWSTARSAIERLDNIDRITEEQITLANNAGMSWTTAYQGGFTSGALAAITISATTSNTLTLDNLPTTSSSTIAFKAGDFIQPNGSRYPYTVVNTVLRGTGNTITVQLNRGLLPDISMTGANILVGNQVSWRMVATKMPTYTLQPGKLVELNGTLELMEVIQ